MIKLVADREYETSQLEKTVLLNVREHAFRILISTVVNGNIYIAQNGSVVRTRWACLTDNLKVTSPVWLGRHFKKLDKLAVTHEENVLLNTLSRGHFHWENEHKANSGYICSLPHGNWQYGSEVFGEQAKKHSWTGVHGW